MWKFALPPEKAALGMNTNAANNNVTDSGGYTQLEEYLNWLADPHGIALTNTTVDVDLCQFTRGFTAFSPVYSVTNATNGTVTLRSGHIARFVPSANFIGQAGFQWTVVDTNGSTITRPMNLFFTPFAQSVNPIWRGDDTTNNWNVLGDYNWFNGQSLLYPFHTGDSVTFEDVGSTNPAVNLVGPLQPASVTFDAAQNYVFSGSGSLSGTMTLNKTGTGMVLTWQTIIGHTYQLQSTPTVAPSGTPWSNVGTPFTAGASGTYSYTNNALSGTALYYQVVAH